MRLIGLLLFFVAFTSCVAPKKFKSLEADYNSLKNKYSNLDVKATEQEALLNKLNLEKTALEKEIKELKAEHDLLQRRYSEFKDLQDKFKNSNQKEMAELLRKIQQSEESLQKKEDELSERNRKLIDLQNALTKKDEATRELRRKVANALMGFEGKGLTVTQKNGKVYVSVDEKLLFKSGSWDIEKPGLVALAEVENVLSQNSDINIVVEGHTDNVRYSGSGALTDNWDLSVKRATSVVRALLKNSKISPLRITAAGCGEYLPIDTNNTKEGRQKNRRTEIILTPKLDELLEILDKN